MPELPPQTVFLIPVYNEEETVAPLVDELRTEFPNAAVCFIDDCSADGTIDAIRRSGCRYVSLPCNLGVGGAMQAGFRYAYDSGYQYAIRIDGDGQHPPAECWALIQRAAQGDVDMVVGSRFLGESDYTSTLFRQTGIRGLAWLLSRACRQRITDPTSGLQMINRRVMYYFAHNYPADYPEPESLAFLSRQGYRFCEVATGFRARQHGKSSIQKWSTFYYVFKVSVALAVDRCRAVDPRFDRHNLRVLS